MSNLKLSSIVFAIIITIDQLIKSFSIESTINSGIIFGNLSNVDPLIRTIFISSFFILVLFLSCFIQFYFLSEKRYRGLSLSMSVFIAGIAGNALDRIRLGYVIDYIRFPDLETGSYILNFADLMQLIGAILCMGFLFRLRHDLWPRNDERGFSLIDPRYQLQFSFKMAFIGFFSALMTGTFSYAFMKVYLPVFDDKLQGIFLISWLVIGFMLVFCAFLFGLILSSRTVGPIHAFKRYIYSLKRKEAPQLKLRKHDSFKELEKLADDIRELITSPEK